MCDVNGDGKPDLVMANEYQTEVSVVLGNGNGTFQNPVNFATGSGPASLALGDVNGDGIPDLVAANRGDYTVSVLLGNGNGTFQDQKVFATGSGPTSVTLADVNGDGRLDLVVANFRSNTVSVLLNLDNGDFTGQVYTHTTGSTKLALSGLPIASTAGSTLTFTLTALDPSNNLVPAYTGTVHFSTTDIGHGSVVPADYTFVPADGGVHVFIAGADPGQSRYPNHQCL